MDTRYLSPHRPDTIHCSSARVLQSTYSAVLVLALPCIVSCLDLACPLFVPSNSTCLPYNSNPHFNNDPLLPFPLLLSIPCSFLAGPFHLSSVLNPDFESNPLYFTIHRASFSRAIIFQIPLSSHLRIAAFTTSFATPFPNSPANNRSSPLSFD